MALAKVTWCDFMIYTFKYRESDLNLKFGMVQASLTDFYFQYILPKACEQINDKLYACSMVTFIIVHVQKLFCFI